MITSFNLDSISSLLVAIVLFKLVIAVSKLDWTALIASCKAASASFDDFVNESIKFFSSTSLVSKLWILPLIIESANS